MKDRRDIEAKWEKATVKWLFYRIYAREIMPVFLDVNVVYFLINLNLIGYNKKKYYLCRLNG